MSKEILTQHQAEEAVHEAKLVRNMAWQAANSYMGYDEDEPVLEDPVAHYTIHSEAQIASAGLHVARRNLRKLQRENNYRSLLTKQDYIRRGLRPELIPRLPSHPDGKVKWERNWI